MSRILKRREENEKRTMPAITSDHRVAVEVEERRVHAVEHVIYHPIHKSIVSVTSHSLQEIDPQYGATIADVVFDLAFLSDKPANGGAAARLLEHVVAVGTHHVAAIFQSRCLAVWDLNDAVLLSVTEVEKQQHKSVAALAASLCKDKWLFYTSEGSNSIKVATVDGYRDPPKKISRKAASRSSQLTALAYESTRRVLAAGASDGSLQLWLFSEENTAVGNSSAAAKEEAAIVAPLLATQTTQSPVVRLVFAATGVYTSLLLVAYQNRVIELWDLAPATTKREPSRVGVFHCLPPQALDFAKKNGDLSFHLDVLAPLLVVHWHAFNGAGSSASAIEMRLGRGGNAAPVSLTDWHAFLPAAPPTHEDGSAVLVYGSTTNAEAPLMAYVSTHHHRHLLPLSVTSEQLEAVREETTKLSLSASCQLGVDQYFTYQGVPAKLLQIARNPEEPLGQTMAFQLQRYAQTSGEVEKLSELPVWTNYQGRQLLPWKLLWNEQQSAACIQLRDPIKSNATEQDAGIAYVLVEIKANAKPAADVDDGRGGTATNVSVTCGPPMDALDVCFCDLRSDDAKQHHAFVLLVLATTGKSIGFQTNCDHVDQDMRLFLTQPVKRIFATPIALTPSATYASLVGSRLLYVVAAASTTAAGDATGPGSSETVVLSDDDLSVPCPTSSSSGFQTRANGETIVDVVWNNGASSSTLSSADTSTKLLVAVKTTQRVVVLSVSPSHSLSVVAEYDLVTDLACPQSLLWMAQTLLFVTSDHHIRYVTPLIPTRPRASHLLCSLPADASGPLETRLLSACSDRLCYSVQDPCSLECKTYLRPLAMCEPLLLGFQAPPPDGRLKAILERDFLVFLATGGTETRNPVTEKMLHVLYHDFGWRDTTTKLVDAMLHPSSSGVAASALAVLGGSSIVNVNSSSTSGYKKLAHLSPALVASLLFHAQKWKDAVRIHLLNDPALEEYAMDDDDGVGSSCAKLPSRTGVLSSKFRWLASVLASVGQAELAIKCLDLAGDDVAIVELLHTHGVNAGEADSLWKALQKDWRQLNPPLAAITTAAANGHGLSLLCCEQLSQTERRSRLLASVRPLNKLTMKATLRDADANDKNATAGRASILYWKRLSPEDTKDVVGVSSTPHFSTDEPKNPASYALFHGTALSTLGLSSSGGGGSGSDDPTAVSATADASGLNDAKMTIGPFLEDEDAVVAYWRFEEGATASDDETMRTLESMDTTKRENHVQILQFGSNAMAFATSSAPVDKGEDGKLQEAFSLRFPATTRLDGEWGAKCAVRLGSTLDIGLVFDEDPYRRKLTFEAWVRNTVLFQKKQAADDEEQGDGGMSDATAAWSDDAATQRVFVSRRGVDQSTWWAFGLCDGGFLFLTFGGHTLKAESDKIQNAAAWQHVAFSIDIASPKHATLKLFLQAKCVATKEISNVDANAKLVTAATKALAAMATEPATGGMLPPPPSTLHLGYALTEYEMTEVRVWATARTSEQLSDMKENYLGIAEAKRRMKIMIHQRNCQCEKCLGRRTAAAKPQLGKAGAALLGAPLFPSTPPPAARDRRRPTPKN